MTITTPDFTPHSAWAEHIISRFLREGGFSNLAAIELAHENMLALVDESEPTHASDIWVERRDGLAFWSAVCLSLQASPASLVEILAHLPRRQPSWAAHLSVSLFVAQASMEALSNADQGTLTIPISTTDQITPLDQIRVDLFHVLWSLWRDGRIEVFKNACLTMTEDDLIVSHKPVGTKQPVNWTPPILRKLADYEVLEAKYLLALIDPSFRHQLPILENAGFILASFSLGYRWLSDHPETAARHFEQACGWDVVYVDDDDYKHVHYYLHSLAAPCVLMEDSEIGPESLPLPYLDFLESVVDDCHSQLRSIEIAIKKRKSEKKSQPSLDQMVAFTEGRLDESTAKRLGLSRLHTLLSTPPNLTNQVQRAIRSAQRLAVSKRGTVHEELISSLHLECGRLIEGVFMWHLAQVPKIPFIPFWDAKGHFDAGKAKTFLETEVGKICQQQSIGLQNVSALEHCFGYDPEPDNIEQMFRFIRRMRKPQRSTMNWSERKGYRFFLAANLWCSVKTASHPWNTDGTFKKLDLSSVSLWYGDRNEQGHFSFCAQGKPQDQKKNALQTFGKIWRWLNSWS